MRLWGAASILVQISVVAFAQTPTAHPAFEVASVRSSRHEVGPDYNNQITYSPDRFNGRNVTLKRLIAEAWHCQMNQVVGPPWIEHNEYDVDARMPDKTSHEQISMMLRSLLADRFDLKAHEENRQMRVYDLTVAKGGPKIKPAQAGAPAAAAGPGFHFHGDMRQFADLLAVQFSIPAPVSPNEPVKAGGPAIPVLDKTGLDGIYDFGVALRLELGTDAFTAWKRALEEQLGLRIESRKGDIPVVVVDDAAKVPTAN